MKHRQLTHGYSVTVEGAKLHVCKQAYAALFQITKGKIDHAMKQISAGRANMVNTETDHSPVKIRINKNFFITCLWQYLVQSGLFGQIGHKFPISGHSYVDSNLDLAHIEKLVSQKNVYSVDEYQDIMA